MAPIETAAETTDTETLETVRLTADVVLFARFVGRLHVALVRRAYDPHAGQWALPGGHVDRGETVRDAAIRECAEETGLAPANLRLVGAYTDPGRDPRGRYVSIAYTTEFCSAAKPTAGTDAADASWVPVSEALAGELAFDHGQILRDALAAGAETPTTEAPAAQTPDEGAGLPVAAMTDALAAIGLLQAAAAGYRTRERAADTAARRTYSALRGRSPEATAVADAGRYHRLADGLEHQARVLEAWLLADLTATAL